MPSYSEPVLDTVTVRFEPTEHSQAELCARLDRAVSLLVNKGVAVDARVEPVFPGDFDERLKGAFVIHFHGPTLRIIEALKSVPGIKTAYAAAPRRAL